MQLKFERDFFMRPVRGSDLNEVIALLQKYGDANLAKRLSEDFVSFLNAAELYFQVILNSNGVLIGAILIEKEKLQALAINPNFLRREVRDEVKRVFVAWSKAYSGKLVAARELIAGDWKSYFKQNLIQIEPSSPGFETLQFVK